MRNRKPYVLALLLNLVALPALAQSLIGSISGVIRDEQGGVLPGVTMTLTGKTGAKIVVTEADGTYRFPAVDPGVYAVTADLSGFKARKQEGISISIGQKLNIDFTLAVAGMTTELTVVGEAPVVDTTSTETTNTISQDPLFNMPLVRAARLQPRPSVWNASETAVPTCSRSPAL